MKKDRLDRQIKELMMLRRYGELSPERISELLGWDKFNRHTFYRDKDALFERFGIEMEYLDKKNVYRITRDADEEHEWLISSLSTYCFLDEFKGLRHRVVLDRPEKGQDNLRLIMEAMDDSVAICFTYLSYSTGVTSEVVMDPYYVRHHEYRWYVFGPVHGGDGSIAKFGLDRISGLARTDRTFIYPNDLDPASDRKYDYGILSDDDYGDEPRFIVVRVQKPQDCYLDSCPIHGSQEKIKETDEYAFYRFMLRANHEFFKRMLSEGSNYVIVYPEEYRQEMIDYYEHALKVYNETPTISEVEAYQRSYLL